MLIKNSFVVNSFKFFVTFEWVILSFSAIILVLINIERWKWSHLKEEISTIISIHNLSQFWNFLSPNAKRCMWIFNMLLIRELWWLSFTLKIGRMYWNLIDLECWGITPKVKNCIFKRGFCKSKKLTLWSFWNF